MNDGGPPKQKVYALIPNLAPVNTDLLVKRAFADKIKLRVLT